MTAWQETGKGHKMDERQWVVGKCTKAGMKGILYKPINKKGLSIQVEKNISKEFLSSIKAKRRNKRSQEFRKIKDK